MAYVGAILDACVLYPAPLRDFLLRLSIQGLYHARWTARIHDEWMTNLLANRPDLSREALDRTRNLMNQAIADCLVTLESDIPDYGLPDAVLQAHGVSARHPDDFVCDLLTRDRAAVIATVRWHRLSLKNPPKTVEEYLATLEGLDLKNTVSELRNSSTRL